jgi:hypothetical protein
MTPVRPRSSPTTSYRPSDGRGTSFPSWVPRHRPAARQRHRAHHHPDRQRWSQAVGAAGPCWVGGVLVDWIVVQLLAIGFLAPAFQLGYLRWA